MSLHRYDQMSQWSIFRIALWGCIYLCLFVGQVISPYCSDQMSKKFHTILNLFTYICCPCSPGGVWSLQKPRHHRLPKAAALHWWARWCSLCFLIVYDPVSEGTKRYDGARTEEEMIKFVARFVEDRVSWSWNMTHDEDEEDDHGFNVCESIEMVMHNC